MSNCIKYVALRVEAIIICGQVEKSLIHSSESVNLKQS